MARGRFTLYTKVTGDIWRRGNRVSRTFEAAHRRAKAAACSGDFIGIRVINDETGAEHDVVCAARRKKRKR
jgi:hypothetical protein